MFRASSIATVVLAAMPFAAAQISFGPATNYPIGVNPDTAAIADLNGDRLLDLAVASDAPDKISILLNNGDGTFAAPTVVALPGSGAHTVVAGDFNNDGKMDLAVSMHNTGTVQILLNGGLAQFSMGASIVVGSDPRSMAVGKFDHNASFDIVVANRGSSNLSVLLNDGGGNFNVTNVPCGSGPRAVVVAELSGDEFLDFAVSTHDMRRVDVFRNLGNGSFASLVNLSIGNKPESLVAADLNSDGRMDLVAGNDENNVGFLTTFLATGPGTFGAGVNTLVDAMTSDFLAAADFDADGDFDVASISRASSSLSVLSNQGNGSFAPAVHFGIGLAPEHVTVGALDANGSLDLVVTNRTSGNVSVLMNQGLAGASTYCVGAPNSVSAGSEMGSTGPLSIAANHFTLQATRGVPNLSGQFFYGPSQVAVPYGDGFRCVGGAISRLHPAVAMNSIGAASRPLDFSVFPANAILPGTTVNFQFWHRDPQGPLGSGINYSNGLRVVFAP
jgi:hypothetical protein